jgi:hypothetical protein
MDSTLMSRVMTAPDYSTDPYQDLIRRIIDAASAYHLLNGFRPTLIHVNGPLRVALFKKGFAEGAEVAGMRIISSPESIADQALCSRDADLFMPLPPTKSAPRKATAEKKSQRIVTQR